MLLIPAVDIKEGRCVRLKQGRAEEEEIFSDDPVAMALKWERHGAEMLHVVDLDGAFKGKLVHFSIIKDIAAAVKIPVQVGGGLRNDEDINGLFRAGIKRVVIGTRAIADPRWVKKLAGMFRGGIIVAVDTLDGKIATRGWKKTENIEAAEFMGAMKEAGVERFVYTDIRRDGMMTGPNLEALEDILSRIKVNLIASGGISSLEHIRALKRLRPRGIEGAIIGKALYAGALNLAEAIKAAS